MTRTAAAPRDGRGDYPFANAHGLYREGHLSTAHDMDHHGAPAVLRLPSVIYKHFFLTKRAQDGRGRSPGWAQHDRALPDAYARADGIKTALTARGGTSPLVPSAERGDVAHPGHCVRQGRSAAWRNHGYHGFVLAHGLCYLLPGSVITRCVAPDLPQCDGGNDGDGPGSRGRIRTQPTGWLFTARLRTMPRPVPFRHPRQRPAAGPAAAIRSGRGEAMAEPSPVGRECAERRIRAHATPRDTMAAACYLILYFVPGGGPDPAPGEPQAPPLFCLRAPPPGPSGTGGGRGAAGARGDHPVVLHGIAPLWVSLVGAPSHHARSGLLLPHGCRKSDTSLTPPPRCGIAWCSPISALYEAFGSLGIWTYAQATRALPR